MGVYLTSLALTNEQFCFNCLKDQTCLLCICWPHKSKFTKISQPRVAFPGRWRKNHKNVNGYTWHELKRSVWDDRTAAMLFHLLRLITLCNSSNLLLVWIISERNCIGSTHTHTQKHAQYIFLLRATDTQRRWFSSLQTGQKTAATWGLREQRYLPPSAPHLPRHGCKIGSKCAGSTCGSNSGFGHALNI